MYALKYCSKEENIGEGCSQSQLNREDKVRVPICMLSNIALKRRTSEREVVRADSTEGIW